jgi:aldose 1-epimerase
LGYDSLKEYVKDQFYVGCLVGRFAGRISRGGFCIGNRFYQLFENDPLNKIHLHGGENGFNKKAFSILSVQSEAASQSVILYYCSKDGEEGYPGNLDLWVTYSLTNENEFIVQYKAKTDKATHLNLTNHSYFNLTGIPEAALKQEILINADRFLITDDNYIPTGKIQPVENTIYDFRKLRRVDYYFNKSIATGYNECYVLNKSDENLAAVLADPIGKRKMTVTTTAPGLVFYTGNYLGGKFRKCQGICLETEYFPDTPNQPEFPATILAPGQEMINQTIYQFSW